METVDASAVIVGVSLATLLMIIRVQSVLQDVLKAAIELASAKPATAAAETQTGVQVQDIWPGPATHNRVRQRNERAPDARYTVEAIYAMDCLWDQLSADEKTAAAVLGYDQDGWDKKIPTNVSMTPWDALGVQCQHPRCAWGGGLDTAATRRHRGEPTPHPHLPPHTPHITHHTPPASPVAPTAYP